MSENVDQRSEFRNSIVNKSPKSHFLLLWCCAHTHRSNRYLNLIQGCLTILDVTDPNHSLFCLSTKYRILMPREIHTHTCTQGERLNFTTNVHRRGSILLMISKFKMQIEVIFKSLRIDHVHRLLCWRHTSVNRLSMCTVQVHYPNLWHSLVRYQPYYQIHIKQRALTQVWGKQRRNSKCFQLLDLCYCCCCFRYISFVLTKKKCAAL